MAIIVAGTKTNPHNNDTLIIKDSEDGNSLKEIPFSSLGVAAVTLTATVGSTLTYSLWADAGATGLIGTFDVINGTNGTGISIPDYDVLRSYSIDECSLDTNGILYRSLGNANVGNAPVPNSAFWYQVPLGGAQTVHNPDADYALGDMVIRTGKLYTPNDAIAGATTAVPFVEGNGLQQWTNMALSPFAPHDIFVTYNIHDTVQFLGKIYQANGNGISGAMSIGRASNQWRNAGTQLVRAPLVTRLTTSGTHVFDADASYAVVEFCGAGAGRGRTNGLSGFFGIAGACGAGGYLKLVLENTALSDMAYSIGLADTTTSPADNANAVAGGDTSITVNSTAILARGGESATSTNNSISLALYGSEGGTVDTVAVTDVQILEARRGGRGGQSSASPTDSGSYTGTLKGGDGGTNPMTDGRATGGNAAGASSSSPSRAGEGYGFGSAAITEGKTDGNAYTQYAGGHGTILITEYFS